MTNSKQAHFGPTLVTGATGLLGAELVDQLLQNKECYPLVCLVRDDLPRSRFFSEKLYERCVVIKGDLRDQVLLERVLNEYEIESVFHLAAQTLVIQANESPVETFDVNIRGTWALLEAARRMPRYIKRLVMASSDKAYGNLHGEKYTEDYPLRGEHPYDVSKSCADLIAQTYAKSYGMNVCITRCGNFFGPGDLNTSRLFPSTINALLENKAPIIRSDGLYIRDYIYVGDGAGAYRRLAAQMLSQKLAGEAFNFSYSLRLSVLDVVKTIGQVMGVDINPVIKNEARNEIPVQTLDSSKAKERLGWEPAFGFEEGVKRTVNWYRAEREKNL